MELDEWRPSVRLNNVEWDGDYDDKAGAYPFAGNIYLLVVISSSGETDQSVVMTLFGYVNISICLNWENKIVCGKVGRFKQLSSSNYIPQLESTGLKIRSQHQVALGHCL